MLLISFILSEILLFIFYLLTIFLSRESYYYKNDIELIIVRDYKAYWLEKYRPGVKSGLQLRLNHGLFRRIFGIRKIIMYRSTCYIKKNSRNDRKSGERKKKDKCHILRF